MATKIYSDALTTVQEIIRCNNGQFSGQLKILKTIFKLILARGQNCVKPMGIKLCFFQI